ncbi:unnamed protein product [Ilex paraguariensis]|uniref:Uncharacterized protein n=1 Tax=Ilex paraguariensis TaxID=185542 RepID=A0ABC8U6S9_9AQUA
MQVPPNDSTWEVSSKKNRGKSGLRGDGAIGIVGGCHSGIGDIGGLGGANFAKGEMPIERGDASGSAGNTLGNMGGALSIDGGAQLQGGAKEKRG